MFAVTPEPYAQESPGMTASLPAMQAPAQSPAQSTAQSPSSTSRSAAPAQERNAYEAALRFYQQGRFIESYAAFQAFLDVYPQSKLTPNALYWQGETHYARQQYSEAIFSFKDVQTRFPRDNKTPDSLLKTAMSYSRLGDAANTSLHLVVLYEDWPDSEAAARARRMGLQP